ncbi:probable glycolate oxidase subunit GlcD at N-terminal half [Coccomyxa sp. Obi]|nr:probable glycolate oxidase subunit GlcD at N-terminal half [Coccomyxa sp. Obi]
MGRSAAKRLATRLVRSALPSQRPFSTSITFQQPAGQGVRQTDIQAGGTAARQLAGAQAGASHQQRRNLVQPAEQEASVPHITVDKVGAISVIGENDPPFQPGVYRNIDGYREEDGRYARFTQEISSFIPNERQFTDPVRTFAYGTDASFYRLNPKMVVKVHSEEEIKKILPIARKHGVPVTFRAAGTSLSGQAITDSVLLKLSHTGKNFRKYTIHGDGSSITVEPGLIGGEINALLARHKQKHGHPIQYKIGPDPSSIDSCMVGGMVANNSSGMCCGVSQNTYHTLQDMRIVFVDGTTLDTADPASREAFLKSHASLVEGVRNLAMRVQSDPTLVSLIRRKFAIKCTTGYSLNALVDFPIDDPIEIIKRLMIGSEGTLGFVSQATYSTVPEWPNKASTFIMFPDVHSACRAASVLRDETAVDAVEMFDRASLTECEKDEGMTRLVPDIKGADPGAAALLVECRGQTPESLQERIAEVQQALLRAKLPFGARAAQPMPLDVYDFKHDKKDYNVYWDVRKGLIPIVGGARETGTSMLIEDVACPVDKLADMTVDLVDMFQRFGYKDASCFGHALEGNLHLVFSQGFRTPEEVQRFSDMMDEMCYIVATKHSGSLKGEHGTGRNVAPYVEMEWGTTAYELMWQLKELFDPEYVLNPGVILNADPEVHIKHLKPSPPASSIVDRCIECGFCESNCPSRDITLTPRQRITTYREISRLRSMPNATPEQQQRLKELSSIYEYQGEETCAADGMCQVKCPVKINTGDLIKSIRKEQLGQESRAAKTAMSMANNYGTFVSTVPKLLNVVDFAHRLVGPKPLEYISGAMNRMSNHLVPTWNPYMPRGASKLNMNPPVPPQPEGGLARQVVYLPSCVTRMMGPAASDSQKASVHEKLLSVFNKAGYEVIYPEGVSSACCGMIFNTKGFTEAAESQVSKLQDALVKASRGGVIPIVCDTSPCLGQLKSSLSEPALKMSLYEPVEFINTFLKDKLEWRQVRDNVAIHVPCTSKKLGVTSAFEQVAGLCAKEVTPSGIPCCGMAGDRGMRYPELAAGALQHIELPSGCTDGYSSSRTCEMNMSNHSGINFRGLVYLVDEATAPKHKQQQQQ